VLKLNTFSIVGRCVRTGQLGVAVSTKLPAVGMLCPFAKAGVGAVASQSFVNPYIGHWALEYLSQGLSAQESLDRILERDPLPTLRQIGIVDAQGRAVSYTGDDCDSWCGHVVGENFAAQGNMLVGAETISTMAERFAQTPDLDLTDRLMQSLEAGQAAGGDKRGRQSAALLVVDKEDYPLVSLRVDEHLDPVAELSRVLEVFKKELLPFMPMLPTRINLKGAFDLDELRRRGVIKDRK
jgi:uncharacterized Ntn-hydrolase superfamily protein